MKAPVRGGKGLDNAVRQRWRRLSVTGRDTVIAAVVTAVLLVSWPYGAQAQPQWVVHLCQVLCGLTLVWRRRYPFSSALATGTLIFCQEVLLNLMSPIAIFVAGFAAWSAVRHGTSVVVVAPLSSLWFMLVINISTGGDMFGWEYAPNLVMMAIMAALPALAAYVQRLLLERAAQRRWEARSLAPPARGPGPAPIAPDVAHHAGAHLSAIRLLAVGGRESLKGPEADPDAVLAAISESSGRAVREVRELLQLLRDNRLEEPAPPGARLDDISLLVSALDGTGVDVDLVVPHGVRDGIPARVEADAYRIVQEALGNVLQHSSARRVVVRLRRRADTAGEVRELVVTVEDDGGAPPGGPGRAPEQTGTGLRGMRERAEALGGRVEAGFRPGQGWRVRAWLPVTGSPDGWRPDDDGWRQAGDGVPGESTTGEVPERDQGAVGG